MSQHRILVDGFSRQECLKLTGCTSSRLAYLEKAGLIVPTRYGENKRPAVFFTWEQLLEIKAIKNLRQDVSLQTVRKIVNYLDQSGFDDSLRNKQLVVVNDQVFWINPDWSDFKDLFPSALKVADKKSKGVGQFVLLVIPPFADIVNDLWNTAQDSEVAKVVNFEEFKRRAKAKPA